MNLLFGVLVNFGMEKFVDQPNQSLRTLPLRA